MKNYLSLTKISSVALFALCVSCSEGQKQVKTDIIAENVENATKQLTIQTDIIEKNGKFINPRTIKENGDIVYVPIEDWCSGFFPGTIWYEYKLTGDKKWKALASKYTVELDSVKY